MQAANPDRILEVLGALEALAGEPLKRVAPMRHRGLLARQRSSGLTAEELAHLSREFIAERRTHARKILGERAYAASDVDFICLPAAECLALTYTSGAQSSVLLSLGLVETLKLSCAAGQLESAASRLESNVDLKRRLGAGAIDSLRAMTRYFNACAVLQFSDGGAVPRLVQSLSPKMQQKTYIVLEAVLMFVLLHELGHVDFARKHGQRDARLTWEFAVQERLSERQEEELLADDFALRSVPEAFMLPLLHAATFLLHVHSYVDVLEDGRSDSHPLAVNRINAMAALASAHTQAEDVGREAVAGAVRAGSHFWSQREPDKVSATRLMGLRALVDSMGAIDWQPALEALVVLDASV